MILPGLRGAVIGLGLAARPLAVLPLAVGLLAMVAARVSVARALRAQL